MTLSGTADLSGATITLSGGPSTYAISVDGLAGNGTVIATIGANVANDAAAATPPAPAATTRSQSIWTLHHRRPIPRSRRCPHPQLEQNQCHCDLELE
ncbi:MAG: hypothetical protein R3E79_45795 [Caldilineaceae bacterium]